MTSCSQVPKHKTPAVILRVSMNEPENNCNQERRYAITVAQVNPGSTCWWTPMRPLTGMLLVVRAAPRSGANEVQGFSQSNVVPEGPRTWTEAICDSGTEVEPSTTTGCPGLAAQAAICCEAPVLSVTTIV